MRQKERPVLLLSAGRSGSTLLQKLLNTHSSLIIWGEHGGILNPIMRSWRNISNLEWIPETEPSGRWLLAPNRSLDVSRWTAWDGSFSKADFDRHLKTFLDSLFCAGVPDTSRWGFKEIRYHDPIFIDFFLDFYPETQFVLLTRSPVDCCVSFASAQDPESDKTDQQLEGIIQRVKANQLTPHVKFAAQILKKCADRVCTVHYERLVEDSHGTMRRISEFLQLDPGFDADSINALMSEDIVSQRKRVGNVRMEFLKSIARPLLAQESEWYEKLKQKP